MASLSGLVAVVSGGAKGIGAAAGARLAEDGARVVLLDTDQEESEKRVAEIGEMGADAMAVTADVSNSDDVRKAAELVAGRLGRVDIVVNSAGIQRYGDVVETPEEVWDEVLGVNLKGIYLMSKHFVPLILEAGGGTIVNVASVQSLAAQRGVAAYAASKGGVVALTRAMAVDFAPRIRVNCVLPGSVDTPMLREAAAKFADDPGDALRQWGKMHPMGRVAQPEEVAAAIAFLAGPQSSFVTGASLLVDGGLLSVIGGT